MKNKLTTKLQGMKKIILIAMVALMAASCTEQQLTRDFGGTMTINVEPNKRVMMATWKNSDLFYMVEDMPTDYEPHDKVLIESSSFGIMESKIIFHETRK